MAPEMGREPGIMDLPQGYTTDKIGSVICLLCVPLLYIPKINLVSIPGQTAGLRIDDLCILAVFSLCLLAYLARRRTIVVGYELFFLLFTLLGAVSVLLMGGNMIYVLRHVEYFTFIIVGLHAARFFNLKSVLLLLIYSNIFIIFLQSMGLIGGFPLGSYKSTSIIGIGSGNWEMASLFCVVYIVLVFSNLCSAKEAFWHGLPVLIALFALGSRLPAAIFILFFLVANYRFVLSATVERIYLVGAAFIIVLLMLDALYQAVAESYLIVRMTTLFTTDYMFVFSKLWQSSDMSLEGASDATNNELTQKFENTDLSLLIRLEKVFGIAKYYLNSGPITWLIGVGPGRSGTALDMGHGRLLFENGIIGYILFVGFIGQLFRGSTVYWPYLLFLLVSMLTLDTYFSYKVMSWIYFIGGFLVSREIYSLERYTETRRFVLAL